MSKSVKLADIAQKLGVSTVTVSKALSGQKGVSEEMREKIVTLAGEMGYRSLSSIKNKKGSNAGYNIAVLIHEKYFDKYDSLYLKIYQYITQHAISNGCFSIMEIVTQEAESVCELPMVARQKKADGIILIGKFSKEYTDFLSKSLGVIPHLFLDYCDTRQNFDVIISDSYYGAYALTNYLFEMGHSKIAYVGSLLSTGSITDRYLGYTKALMEHGIEVKKDWIIKDRDENNMGRLIAPEDFVLPKTMPTAFVCNCDLTASALIKRLEDEGYNIPEDISVVGYDNYIYPGLCDVEITTYEVDTKEMARCAVETIYKKISGEKYKKGIQIVEGHMVIKKSVKEVIS